MAIGPVEYIILGFPGNDFNGDVAPALAKLIESNTIRLLDLLFIGKDAAGDVLVIEFDELEALAAFAGLEGEVGGVISDEDVAHVAAGLEPNTSAALAHLGRRVGDGVRRRGARVRRCRPRGRTDSVRARRSNRRRSARGRLNP